ncbi:RagB/SusD family nutrient uptake outer membrane protein [Chitinophaga defluvii]|uniref:RagB/SusD family nutrient uptake outer membrane protein n=1 Tax=Chitinophaga defluvii TaxID=3163343 RepID=A0ABV2TH24_9BACT
MVKIFKWSSFFSGIAVVAMLSGCSNSLEVVPKDQVSDATLWTSTGNADLFLNNIYGTVTGPFNVGDTWENFSDNAINGVAGGYSATVFAEGNYTPSNAPSLWGNYNNIRKANIFIENVTASGLADKWKNSRLAEARYLRAYFYAQLWSYYGGVPIVTKVLNQAKQGDEIFYARNTFDETFKFITDELSAIAGDLVLKPESGRVSRGAALTLKAWCELFAASPLNNAANDVKKWELAAKTYKQVMDLGVYDLFPDYRTLFLEDNNNNVEVIFDKPYYRNNSQTALQGPSYVGADYRGYGLSNPTQELVDEYVMANGLPISDPNSGYDPMHPYIGREQRFYDDIIYDGAEWLGVEMVMKQGVGSKSATDLSNLNEATNTGYYWKKMMDPKYATVGNSQNSAHFILFRYAEVLLSYAEAQNEFAGPDQSVYDAVNKVRERVKLPELKKGLGKDEMRKAILRERRVELSLEEKRWLDLVRLKQADQKLNGPLHAVVINLVNGKWQYSYVPAPGGTRAFHPEKNYWFPIPQDAIDRNSKLKQNPNYN